MNEEDRKKWDAESVKWVDDDERALVTGIEVSSGAVRWDNTEPMEGRWAAYGEITPMLSMVAYMADGRVVNLRFLAPLVPGLMDGCAQFLHMLFPTAEIVDMDVDDTIKRLLHPVFGTTNNDEENTNE